MTRCIWHRLLCIAIAAVAISPGLVAQQTGTFAGRVVDPQGKPLAGANVAINNTALRTSTGPDGAFSIPNVPAGPRSAVVSHIMHETRTVWTNVPAGAVATQSCYLPWEPYWADRSYTTEDSMIAVTYPGRLAAGSRVHVRAFRVEDMDAFSSARHGYPALGVSDRDRDDEEDDDSENGLPYGLRLTAEWDHTTIIPASGENGNTMIGVPLRAPGSYVVELTVANRRLWAQMNISDIGIITKISPDRGIAFLVNARTGRRMPNVRLECIYQSGTVRRVSSGSDGIVQLPRQRRDGANDYVTHLTGEYRGSPIIATLNVPTPDAARHAMYLHTDRPVYRPSQRVNYRGILRDAEDAAYQIPGDATVTVNVLDARGRSIKTDTLPVSRMGTFHGALELGAEPALGQYSVVVTAVGNVQTFPFMVLEYKKPEFSVELKPGRACYGPGETITATTMAKYYFGSPVAEASVEYRIFRTRMPGAGGNSIFATAAPAQGASGPELVSVEHGTLGHDGTHTLRYTLGKDTDADFRYHAEAQVVDNSRRVIIGSADWTMARSDFRVTIQAAKNYYHTGERPGITVSLNRFDGRSAANVELALRLRQAASTAQKQQVLWEQTARTDSNGQATIVVPERSTGGVFELVAVVTGDRRQAAEATHTLIVAGPGLEVDPMLDTALRVIPERSGYLPGETAEVLVLAPREGVDALVTAEGATLYTERTERLATRAAIVEMPMLDAYAPGVHLGVALLYRGSMRNADVALAVEPLRKRMRIEISGNRAQYRPGDSATIRIRALDGRGRPVADAELGTAMIDDALFAIAPDQTPPIFGRFYSATANRITTGFLPSVNLTIHPAYLAQANRELLEQGRRRKMSGADRDRTASRTTIQHAVALSSGVTTAGVNGFAIRGGRAEETAIAVDGLAVDDVFSGGFGNDSDDNALNARYKSDAPPPSPTSAPADGSGVAGESFALTTMRSNFQDAIAWQPDLLTDNNGYASFGVRLPDNITTWRVTVRGVDRETRVGEGAESFVARKNLMVRMETPRFATQGDRMLVATTVHNYLPEQKRVTVRMRAEHIELADHDTTVTIPAGGEQRIDWSAAITGVDSATLSVRALTDEESDAMQTTLPITPRGLKVSASAAAELARDDRSATMTFDVPEATDPTSRTLSVSLSPSYGSAVIGALDDLIGYPYGCAEQTMSRFLPTIVVANVLRDLRLPFDEAKRKEMPKMVAAGLEKLYGYQHTDGGWGWWDHDATHPFMTAYIMYGLTVARKAGYDIDNERYRRGRESLWEQIRQRSPGGSYGAARTELDPTSEAYMLYVAGFVSRGQHDPLIAERTALLAKRSGINSYAVALLALAAHYHGQKELAASLVQRLGREATGSDGKAYWTGITWEHAWQQDNVETSAFAVKALMETGTEPDMLKRGIAWLMARKQGNSWGNTRQSAMIVYTMADYLRSSAGGDAGYTLRVKVNGNTVFERAVSQQDLMAPDMRVTVKGTDIQTGRNTVTVEKTGGGMVNAAAWIDYYVDVAQVRPANAGFTVTRDYYVLERVQRGDVWVYQKEPFTGTVHSGQEMLVKVHIRPDSVREYFLLEDPLPAGCEVVQDVSGYTIEGEAEYQPARNGADKVWNWWYSSRDVRDEKIAFFAQRLEAREYEFSYILRAQIPGTFSVMPSIGMLNYYPEVRGNSAAEQMMILK